AREESYIFLNYMQGAYLDNSTKLATYIHDELVKALGTRKRGVKQAGFIVLKNVAMPTVLVETAFITNPGDLKKLNSAAEREKMARAIFNAFVTYKNELETNSAQVRYAPGVRDDAPGVTYAIQIASAKGRITNFKRFNLPEPARELHAGDRYCYYVRECSSYDEAVNAQRETRKSVKDCFVIAIRGGKLIPVAEARRVENERKK
ncbi:MAG: N-acetylmuramoyl-L-alanine amidase, partial [Odoribacteraceae bacterium]|nr:N-acetylmuramoyl-L-alanine amidase [Odoribacteraceae bacterium]